MSNVLSGICWKGQSARWEELLPVASTAVITPMKGGLEAEVYRITLPEAELVLKIWNRESRPDISMQYRMLEQLHLRGLAVSQPWGWGVDELNHKVLLTSFDGVPVATVDSSFLLEMADILLDIHKLPAGVCSVMNVPVYDFTDYFFFEIAGHPEIRMLARELADQAGVTRQHLIHADYHPGNILEAEGKYTVIDWTNVQLGDPRYDIAWSIILIRIYISGRYADGYQRRFLEQSGYTPAELELFEALACLRWLQLHRSTGIPVERNTIRNVRSIIGRNAFLPEGLL
ncbi:aminoglycoside phosphotransferase family protein [Paenibacillus sp. MMS20-IR301]|uniref:aminoglycoside phosphotransferase family protein n=1 Tax=Paenibacillus sp. MMS20-IR301 TaxID=2895946 RepID=UPI0028EA1698|nr:aminoglycoside phosphotransferase family protein [Paenibacillus sp. MMS20-IR301]WNS44744.1 aminoglycoside phosphotransferase family protein [Paenibacillus sp. MMS20-IR301]